MADQTKRVVLELILDSKEAIKQSAALTSEIKKLQTENKKMQAELDKDADSFKDNAQAIEVNQARIRELSREKRVLQNITDQEIRKNKAAKGSIDELRAQLSVLTRQYNALSEEERENSAAGKQLTQTIKGVSDKLKEQEKAIGDTRRNVGNYLEDIKEGVKGITVFGVNVGDVTDKLGQGAQGFKAFTGGITTAGGAMKALIAIPIVAVLAAIVGGLYLLSKAFTSTDAGADKLAQITDALATGFNVLLKLLAPLAQSVGELGDVFVNAFKNPVETVKELGRLIQENVINRFKAFGVIAKAVADGDLKAFVNGNIQLITGVTDATGKLEKFGQAVAEISAKVKEAAIAQGLLTKALQDLEDDQAKFTTTLAETNKEVSNGLIAAKNVNLSFEERLKILDRISAAEKSAGETRATLAAREAKLLQDQAFIQNGLTEEVEKFRNADLKARQARIEQLNDEAKITDDTASQAREAFNNVIDLESESANLLDKINNRREALLNQIFQVEQTNRDRRAQLLEDELERDLKRFDIAAEGEIRAARQAGENIEALIALQGQRRKEIEDAINEKRLQERIKQMQEETAAREALNAELDRIEKERQERIRRQQEEEILFTQRFFERQQTEAIRQLESGRLSREAFELESQERRLLALQTELEQRRRFGQDTLALEREIAQQSLLTTQTTEQAKLKVKQDVANGILSLTDLLLGEGERANAITKAITLTQLTTDTVSAISSLIKYSEGNPLNSLTGGLAGVATYAGGLARIFSNLAQAKRLLGLDEGGYTGKGVGDPDESGFRIAGYVHQDEWVAPKWMNEDPKFGPVIASLEQARKRGFASGGFTSDGGYAIAAATAPALDAEKMVNDLGNKFLAAIEKQKPPIVDVREVTYYQNRRARVKEEADL